MSDSAKLHLCYGTILLILSFLCLAGFVSFIWLAVLVKLDFLAFTGFAGVATIFCSINCIDQLVKAGTYIEEEYEEEDE